MAMLKDRQLLVAQIQPALNTDPAGVGDELTFLVASGIEFQVVGRKLERAQSLQWMGVAPPMNIGEALKIKFKTEVRGGGVGEVIAPEIDPLLRACNYYNDEGAGIYTLISAVAIDDESEMVCFYFYQDRIWHTMLNCRGTVATTLKAGEYGVDNWEFTGTYGGPARVAAIPPGTFDMTLPPRFVSAACTIGEFTPKFETLTLDLANKIAKRVDANSATGIQEYMITDREPKGSIDPEVPDITQASLTTNFGTLNSELVFTANATKEIGAAGNAITVTFADTGTAGAETVGVAGKAIVINCEAGVSTATQCLAALTAAGATISDLVSVAKKVGNDGSGVVSAAPLAHLTGGEGMDFWKEWESSNGLPIEATCGTVAGNRCKFTVSSAVLEVPTYADRENILTHGLSFSIHPAAGNDEITRDYS